MSLAAGSRLGPYEVTAALGAGGMGEVYRARDTKLGREVAIKTLPSTLAHDADRLARFEREAKLLAALNHAHIASIYGLDQHDGTLFLAMELIEGKTLEETLNAGALPIEDALKLALQIAQALEAAHEKGVIHRDLKPANVMITRAGQVKILDFGLAKAFSTEPEEASAKHSPALSLAMTQQGLILGTAGYMSPEQASGQATDQRADIWSFGVVLYEMLTGLPLFSGESVPHILADVLRSEPNWNRLPKNLHPRLKLLLERCLEKKARNRYHGIADARVDIEKVLADPRGVTAPTTRASVGRTSWAWAVPVVAVVALAAGWVLRGGGAPDAIPAAATHFALPPPGNTTLGIDRAAGPNMAVSPDGRYLAFIAEGPGGDRMLWVRSLASLEAQRLERTESAFFPFWSPDSQHIGYFTPGKLMRIAVAGGAPLTVSDAGGGEGGTWFRGQGGDDVIVFVPNSGEPLHRVPAMGGISTPLTQLRDDERAHVFPQLLPDGRHVLFTALARDSGVYVQNLDTAERTLVLPAATRAVYSPPGLLLYVRGTALLAQRFDLDALVLEGEAVAIAQDVRATLANATVRSAFAAVPGIVVYRRGTSSMSSRVRWYERDGTPGDFVVDPGDYQHLELSPDGKFLAVSVGSDDGSRDLWLKELASGTWQRLTATPGTEAQQVWSPDSRRLAFVSSEGLMYTELGSGRLVPVPGAAQQVLLHSWTPDSRSLLTGVSRAAYLVPAPLDGVAPNATSGATATAPQELFREDYATDHFRVSPDGRWVAYTSQESGRAEVMIAAFPGFTSRRQISQAGGTQPQWRADGQELFFHATDQRLMAVDVTPGETLQTGPPRELFRTNPAVLSAFIFQYAATPDGQRFLLVEPTEGTVSQAEPLYVLTNWQALLGAGE